MSTYIAFHKIYTRQSKSPWQDKARVVMLFEPESKGGIYLHLGDEGFNGLSVSQSLQSALPAAMRQQYIEIDALGIVFDIFGRQMAEYCTQEVDEVTFMRVFLCTPNRFFAPYVKRRWFEALRR